MVLEESQDWMTPIIKYLTRSFKPTSEEEVALVRKGHQSSPWWQENYIEWEGRHQRLDVW